VDRHRNGTSYIGDAPRQCALLGIWNESVALKLAEARATRARNSPGASGVFGRARLEVVWASKRENRGLRQQGSTSSGGGSSRVAARIDIGHVSISCLSPSPPRYGFGSVGTMSVRTTCAPEAPCCDRRRMGEPRVGLLGVVGLTACASRVVPTLAVSLGGTGLRDIGLAEEPRWAPARGSHRCRPPTRRSAAPCTREVRRLAPAFLAPCAAGSSGGDAMPSCRLLAANGDALGRSAFVDGHGGFRHLARAGADVRG
jgi:hypothetical protein